MKIIKFILILILITGISSIFAQTSFNISNQTTGDTLFTIDNDGRIGIGTTTPDASIDIKSSTVNDFSSLRLGNLDGSRYLFIHSGNPTYYPIIRWHEGEPLRFATWTDTFTELMRIAADGNVGIGTTTPLTKLEVADTIFSSFGGFMFPDSTVQETAAGGGGAGNTLDEAYDQGGAGVGRDITADNGSVRIIGNDGLYVQGDINTSGSVHSGGSLFLYGSGSEGGQLSLRDGDDDGGWIIDNYGNSNSESIRIFNPDGATPVFNALVIGDTGNVGIGIGGPEYPLDVDGTIQSRSGGFRFPDGTTQTTSATGGGAASINDLTDARSVGNSVFLGSGAGAIDDTSDNRNAAVGIDALNRNTTGNNNTANGYNAKYWNNVGNDNVSIGYQADYYNEGGSQNTILGYQAGAAGGPGLHSKSGNVFLGYQAGYGESGDNKLYIENSDSDTPLIGGDFASNEVYLNGTVGIGTTTPSAGLHLHGTGFPSSFMYLSSETGGSAGFRLYEGSIAKWHIFNSYTLDGLQIYNDNGQTAFFADQSTANVSIGTTTTQSNTKLYVLGEQTGVRGQVNNDGSYIITGVAGHANGSDGENRGISGFAYEANRNRGVYGQINNSLGGSDNAAIFGQAGPLEDYAGYFVGNLNATGTNTKGASITKIDHPLDPENKYLQHSSVESSDMMNVYNGNVVLDSNGEAWITLPDWFDALNKDFRYQLTPIGQPGPNLYISEKIRNNQFKISGGKTGMEVSWQLTGIRKDNLAERFRIDVEKNKSPDERGYYLHPSVFGLDESMGIHYQQRKMIENQEIENLKTSINK